MSNPSYPWFQERDALLEKNHLATSVHRDIQNRSYGNQNRQEKLSFAIRDAVERNGNTLTSAIERTASEDRTTTLKSELDTRANTSHDFAHVLLIAKDIGKMEAKDIGNGKVEALASSFSGQNTTAEANSEMRMAITEISNKEQCLNNEIINSFLDQSVDLKNNRTEEYGEVLSEQEGHFSELGQLHMGILTEQQRGITALGVQAEQHQGETNRHAAEYRSDVDGDLDSFAAAQALIFSEIRTNLAVQSVNNMTRLKESCCDTKSILTKKTSLSQGLLRTNEQTHLGIALSAEKKKMLLYKIDKHKR